MKKKEDSVMMFVIAIIYVLSQIGTGVCKLVNNNVSWGFVLFPSIVLFICMILLVVWYYIRLVIAVIKYWIRQRNSKS